MSTYLREKKNYDQDPHLEFIYAWRYHYSEELLTDSIENLATATIGTLFIIWLKIPFGEIFSKIIILSSSAFLFSTRNRNFENAVQVRLPRNGMPK